jgi:hypothetical protein
MMIRHVKPGYLSCYMKMKVCQLVFLDNKIHITILHYEATHLASMVAIDFSTKWP